MTQHIFPRVNEQANALRNAAELPYHDLLDGEIVSSALGRKSSSFECRMYTPLVTLWTFLTQVLDSDHSCRKAVSSLSAFLVSQGEPAVSPDTSNYCKARKRLPLSFIIRLVRKLGERLEQKANSAWLWKGRSVHMVDGSTASMPDTPANQAGLSSTGEPKARRGISAGAVRGNHQLSHGGSPGCRARAMPWETDRGNEFAPHVGAADESGLDSAGRSVFRLVFRNRRVASARDRWRLPYAPTTQDRLPSWTLSWDH